MQAAAGAKESNLMTMVTGVGGVVFVLGFLCVLCSIRMCRKKPTPPAGKGGEETRV